MMTHKKPHRRNIGLPPGTAVYIGDRPAADMALSIIVYDTDSAYMHGAKTIDQLLERRSSAGVSWININGLKDVDAIKQLAEAFNIHPLTVEDILNTEQRPKVEEFIDYVFISIKALHWEPGSRKDPDETRGPGLFHKRQERLSKKGECIFDQISIVVTKNAVITFQEIPGDAFDGVRRRIMGNAGQIRKLGSDYLAYAIMDAAVDEYFLTLDRLGEDIDDFEERALDAGEGTLMAEIQQAKKNLLQIKRAITPLRENIGVLSRAGSSFFKSKLRPFFQDLHENITQAIEMVEHYRELLIGAMEVNLAAMSHQMNKVMKVLTMISTIFIPLTFIVGVYGMNFTYMPEIPLPWAYPAVWTLMVIIALGMILAFKRRHWL